MNQIGKKKDKKAQEDKILEMQNGIAGIYPK